MGKCALEMMDAQVLASDVFFFFNDTATTEIYTLSLHDALPISLKGKSSHKLQKEFPELRKKYWGQHLWARGYFCTTVGAVTEELIKEYIENQDEEDKHFKIWDEQVDKQKKKVKEILQDLYGAIGL